MRERQKKVTIEQIRTLFPFDMIDMSVLAGVDITTMYFALNLLPIYKKDAEKILGALSRHTGLALSLEQVDMVIWEHCLLLWVVRASSHKLLPQGELREAYHLVYARDQQHAAFLSQDWLAQYPHLSCHSFIPWPMGFHIGNEVIIGRLVSQSLPGSPPSSQR